MSKKSNDQPHPLFQNPTAIPKQPPSARRGRSRSAAARPPSQRAERPPPLPAAREAGDVVRPAGAVARAAPVALADQAHAVARRAAHLEGAVAVAGAAQGPASVFRHASFVSDAVGREVAVWFEGVGADGVCLLCCRLPYSS